MNLIETERLVRKLTEALQSRAPEAQARRLAQAYADLCRTVNHRLEQCASMLAQGDEHQALQLAESPPPVLELASRLAFRESSQWRSFCQEHDLPVPDPLEGAAIRRLNGAYGHGISADHALYREYREAVLLHQDEQAVKALRSISWRNPADTNAPRELERLERKILRERLEKLQVALATGDDAFAVQCVKQIEALDFQARPGGDVWRHGQEARCRSLLAEARKCRTEERWADAATLLTDLRAILEERQLTLEKSDVQVVCELEQWVGERHKGALANERFERVLGELRRMVARHEERQVAGDAPGRAELREELEALRHKSREVELADRPVGDELPAQVRKLQALFESRLARLDRRRRVWVVAGVIIFALTVVAVSLVLWNRRQARDLVAELDSLQRALQVSALDLRIGRIERERPRLAASSQVKAALAASKDFLSQERQKMQDADALLKQLEVIAAQGFTNLAPDQVQTRIEAAQSSTEAVAKDYQTGLHNRLRTLHSRWESWLDGQRNKRAAEFEQHLRQASELAAQDLRYERGPESVRLAIAALGPQLSDLQMLARAPVARLVPPADAQARMKALQQRVQAMAAELGKWDQVQAAWLDPSTIEAYLESLKAFQRSEFAEPAQARAAGEVLALDISVPALLSSALLPGQAEAWAQFRNQAALRLQPDDVMPAERTKIRQLRDDENIHNVHLYREILRSAPIQDTNRIRVVFLRGQWENTRSALQRGVVYDPQESPETLRFSRQQFISNIEFEDLGRAPEAEAFESTGCGELLDNSGTNFGTSLIRVLDQVNRESKASSLFRAWLTLRLYELLDLRPNEWGIAWAPALVADRQKLRSLGADSLRSGDWLVPGRKQVLAAKFEDHFQAARKVSYMAQARFLHALARRAMDTGFALAGHADTEGKPAVSPGLNRDTELWGWAARNRSPALLFRLHREGNWSVSEPVLPFSPLLTFRADARQLLASIRQSLDSSGSEAGDWLPPLFEEKGPP